MTQKVVAVAIVSPTDGLESAVWVLEPWGLEVKRSAGDVKSPHANGHEPGCEVAYKPNRSRASPPGYFARLWDALVSRGYRVISTFVRIVVLPSIGILVSSVLEAGLTAVIAVL